MNQEKPKVYPSEFRESSVKLAIESLAAYFTKEQR